MATLKQAMPHYSWVGIYLLLFGWWKERAERRVQPRRWPHQATVRTDEAKEVAA